VRHWSVKIQHLGTRKSFSLRAINEKEAAAEACGIYKAVVTRGWNTVDRAQTEKNALGRFKSNGAASSKQNGFHETYWMHRLIHRKYAEMLQANGDREISVRIDHAGTSHYFPLATDTPKLAARNAARIYRVVVRQGWASASRRFPRELSVAFRWSDNPLAWTYTTIHTQTDLRMPPAPTLPAPSAKLNVAVVESDPGLRLALSWCINQQDGCRCVAIFGSASPALDEARKGSIALFLVSQNLGDKSGVACLNELNAIAPKSHGVLLSVFEDSEQLFKAAPGGAPCYLFRRTPPTKILAPIDMALKNGTLTRDHFKKSIRRYFEDVIMSSPIHGSANELSHLTQREHEILGLLSKGHPDKEIADLLRISTWTVHGHLKKIFEKLGAHNRTDAVVKYLNK
jgi:DNA-binding NarL/FixJ family response regulator